MYDIYIYRGQFVGPAADIKPILNGRRIISCIKTCTRMYSSRGQRHYTKLAKYNFNSANWTEYSVLNLYIKCTYYKYVAYGESVEVAAFNINHLIKRREV